MFNFVKEKMVIWNTSPFVIKLEFKKEKMNFHPFEEIETTDTFFANSMYKLYKDNGVVILSEKDMKEGESFENYKLRKEYEGLMNLFRWKQRCIANEEKYIQELKTKTNVDKDSISTVMPKLQKELAHIKKMINQIKETKEDIAEEIKLPERKDWTKELKKETKKTSKKKSTPEELLKGI